MWWPCQSWQTFPTSFLCCRLFPPSFSHSLSLCTSHPWGRAMLPGADLILAVPIIVCHTYGTLGCGYIGVSWHVCATSQCRISRPPLWMVRKTTDGLSCYCIAIFLKEGVATIVCLKRVFVAVTFAMWPILPGLVVVLSAMCTCWWFVLAVATCIVQVHLQ